MDSTDNTTSSTTTETQEQIDTTPVVRPKYEGDKGEYKHNLVRDTPIEKKPIAVFSYGERVRIAAIHQRYEEMMDHII
jgi:hypothetical protein